MGTKTPPERVRVTLMGAKPFHPIITRENGHPLFASFEREPNVWVVGTHFVLNGGGTFMGEGWSARYEVYSFNGKGDALAKLKGQ